MLHYGTLGLRLLNFEITIRGSQMNRYKVAIEFVLLKSVNTFILLEDENFGLVERDRSLMDTQPHPLLHFLVRMKPMSTNVFLQVAKMLKSQGERSGLYGGF